MVIRYLTEEHKMDANLFKAVGYGEFRPVSTNDTKQGRSNNRRVVLIMTNEEMLK
ncbi:hypothetical protein ACFSCZ_18280 [Siminovitchia sediminis]|uniref:OmpA-like domain-containing protein n=1 Tax=Siminovitchia sediminis TaxID=1274353 RepID=A0ABW4KN46_9BACI